MASAALFRYNFRVLLFRNWWLLVFPIAASQFTVFWNIITQRTPTVVPAQTVEMVSSLLAAFLSAHLLSAEYQSRIGAILASKPLDIGKVVRLRLVVVMSLVWALALLSMAAYYFGLGPYDIVTTAAAGISSTLFLAMLALTFATLFRNPLTGFGIAALYWALDLPSGPPINPIFTLKSLSVTLMAKDAGIGLVTDRWWISKAALLIAALLLYFMHSRLVFRLGSPLTIRLRRRTLAGAGVMFLFYLISGASMKVAFGYTHRSELFPEDGIWFRQQFAPFGPIPVDMVFGPAFRRYIGEMPNSWRIQSEGEGDLRGDTVRHHRELREVIERMPTSMWAPSAAEAYARLLARKSKRLEDGLPYYIRIERDYRDSPYLAFALREKSRLYADAGRTDEAVKSYEELMQRRPDNPYKSEALHYLVGSDLNRGDLATAEKRAREWIVLAPIYDRFNAFVALSEILSKKGDLPEAKRAAQDALTAIRDFRTVAHTGRLPGARGQATKWEHDAVDAQQKALALLK